jgi:hypothetical protein
VWIVTDDRDLIQKAAEDELEQAELDAVIDVGEDEREAALERLRREPDDDDQPVSWRRR